MEKIINYYLYYHLNLTVRLFDKTLSPLIWFFLGLFLSEKKLVATKKRFYSGVDGSDSFLIGFSFANVLFSIFCLLFGFSLIIIYLIDNKISDDSYYLVSYSLLFFSVLLCYYFIYKDDKYKRYFKTLGIKKTIEKKRLILSFFVSIICPLILILVFKFTGSVSN